MKQFILPALLVVLLSCNQNKTIIDPAFVDSLITHYTPSKLAETNKGDLEFWKMRVDTMQESFVNLQKYAQALAARFHIYADIHDLKKADSIMKQLNRKYKEPGFLLTLAGYNMLQHQFSNAQKYIDEVVQMKAEPYATQMMSFDANFESGNYYTAAAILKKNFAPKDYAYNFRMSKQDHYKGLLDSSISHMLQATSLATASPYLQQAALSNAADLYIHKGNLEKAAQLYQQCIKINSCDFHSIMGLGWIALVHDGNDTLANKLFAFVHRKLKSPDPLLKLSQAAEENDSTAAKNYAEQFVLQAGDPVYGNMYNKYLIQLYTGILHNPVKALAIAKKEIANRTTPQTYCWLAWTLFYNNQPNEAYSVFRNYVSGKPLEGLELYWMGKLMKGLNKGYNAQQFFKAAAINKYDLTPLMRKDLEKNLE